MPLSVEIAMSVGAFAWSSWEFPNAIAKVATP